MRPLATLRVTYALGGIEYELQLPERERYGPSKYVPTRPIRDAELAELQALAAKLLRRTSNESFSRDAKLTGETLYKRLIPPDLGQALRAVHVPLLVSVPRSGFPFELFYADEFWGMRYALGKQIRIDLPPREPEVSRPSTRPRALIICSDPRSDLEFANREAERLLARLGEAGVEVRVSACGEASVEGVRRRLAEGYDLIHYCGHVVPGIPGGSSPPGLLLEGEQVLSAEEIKSELDSSPFVFLNGCASARNAMAPAAGAWEEDISSVAYGFIAGGARAVVATLSDITDKHATDLAVEFYTRVLNGEPLGEALRLARKQARAIAPQSSAWLSFILYGNPSEHLLNRATEPLASLPSTFAPSRRSAWFLASLSVAALLLGSLIWWLINPPPGTEKALQPGAPVGLQPGAPVASEPGAFAEQTFTFDRLPELTRVPDLFFGPVPESFYIRPQAGEPTAPELHVIGVYEGEAPSTTPDGQLLPKPIEVFVRRTGRPLILYLTSYSPVVWEIKPENGVRLEAIYRGGYAQSVVRNAPDSVPVRDGASGVFLYQYESHDPGEPGGQSALAQVSSFVGIPVETFQGSYRGQTFVVPAYQDAAIVRALIEEHGRLLTERTATVPAPYDIAQGSSIVRRGEGATKSGVRVILNVRGASLQAVTYADVDRKFYGTDEQNAYVIDPLSGEATKLEPPPEFPRLEWLGGITYDAGRKRVVITTLWHTGFHQTYDPITKEWRVFPVDKTRGGLNSIAYDPKQGLIYGLGSGENGVLSLYDSDLNPVRAVRTSFDSAIAATGPDQRRQMAIVGDQLVVCHGLHPLMALRLSQPTPRPPHLAPALPSPSPPSRGAAGSPCTLDPVRGVVCYKPAKVQPADLLPPTPRCFLVDPASGEVRLVSLEPGLEGH